MVSIRKLLTAATLFPLTIAFTIQSALTRGVVTSSTTALSAMDVAKAAIANNKVMVFSKSYCPYCTKAKSALKELNVDYGVYELDNMKNGGDIQAALATMTGQRTVPNIFVKGKHVGGCDNTLAAIADGSFKKMLED